MIIICIGALLLTMDSQLNIMSYNYDAVIVHVRMQVS